MSYPNDTSEVKSAQDAPVDPEHRNSEGFVKESDVPLRASSIRREDLVPFVKQGFVAEMTAETPLGPKVTSGNGRSDNMPAEMLTSAPTVTWPTKYDVLGVEVSSTDYDDVVRRLAAAALRGQPALATFAPVHAVVTAALDPRYRYRLNAFHVVAPDGQPIRWALNALHKTNLPERVCGPETMLRLCSKAADEGIGIFLYGTTPNTLDLLKANLEDRFPAIRIVGMESPPFRPLSEEENDAAVERINESGAGFVFIGLGTPRQDAFAYLNRNSIKAVQLCVGAAFDFHAGKKRIAPMWMQKSGMEWAYRLIQEPRRLWKRYLVTNTTFIYLMTRRLILGR